MNIVEKVGKDCASIILDYLVGTKKEIKEKFSITVLEELLYAVMSCNECAKTVYPKRTVIDIIGQNARDVLDLMNKNSGRIQLCRCHNVDMRIATPAMTS